MANYRVLSRIKLLDGYHLEQEVIVLDENDARELLALGCLEMEASLNLSVVENKPANPKTKRK